jgi:hypothetical protein
MQQDGLSILNVRLAGDPDSCWADLILEMGYRGDDVRCSNGDSEGRE